MSIAQLAEAVGDVDPVTIVGGRTHWDAAGTVDADAREVRAPAGIVTYEPEEMTVRVLAGTPVGELQAELARAGQRVFLPGPPTSTVGGTLALGRNDVRRLGWGEARDTVLEMTYVSAAGTVVKAGGPTVKNVTGFDLCRLMVGAVGTLGFIGEVVLRTNPLPAAAAWFEVEADPFELRRRLYRPSALLWDGARCWVHLEGHGGDVAAQRQVVASSGPTIESAPPALPPHVRRVRPAALRSLEGCFVAEVGVGVVHVPEPVEAPVLEPRLAALQRTIKVRFDPSGRMNPGRRPDAARH